jgi:transposase InsO family protein
MPWLEADPIDQRLQFITDHRLGLYTVTELCARDCVYCYPLTIADQHTRYLLTCHGLPSTHGAGARSGFERAFRAYALPAAIRTDNGGPFATSGIHGLSQLNAWWMRPGIQRPRSHPGRPQQNGAHQRMHKTLKRGAIRSPCADAPAQQRAFNRFRTEYNEERPPGALGGRTPASRYRPAPRADPRVLPPREYSGPVLSKNRMTGSGRSPSTPSCSPSSTSVTTSLEADAQGVTHVAG